MNKITAIHSTKGQRGQRVKILLDDESAFSLETELALKQGLKIGQELSAEQLEALTKSDKFYRCLNAAMNLLSYRPRSKSELHQRLQRRGFDDSSIEAAIAKLAEQRLVDDEAFAQFWKDNRDSFSPRSQWFIRAELKRKGVATDIVDRVVRTADDSKSAYQVAVTKARRLPRSDYQSFRLQLGGYLHRRGFSYGVINKVVEQVWKEREEQV